MNSGGNRRIREGVCSARGCTGRGRRGRVEIELSPAQLDRFVGEYSLGATTVPVTRDGNHLLFHSPQATPLQLLAMSPSEFFVKKPDLVVAFEADSADASPVSPSRKAKPSSA